MEFDKYFHKTSLLDEANGVLDQVSQMHSLQEFLQQQKSPYMLLQILAIALTSTPESPGLTLDQINQNPSLLTSNDVRKKMHYFMTKTRFSNDFNALYRGAFPKALGNPVEWAKQNKEITTDLNNPQIKGILDQMVKDYSKTNP